MCGMSRPQRRHQGTLICVAASAVATATHQWRSHSLTFLTPPRAASAAAAAAAALGGPLPGFAALGQPDASPPSLELPQLLLSEGVPIPDDMSFITNFEKYGPDEFFYGAIAVSLLILFTYAYIWLKPWFEYRNLTERINNKKLKFITQESETNAIDKFELARMYISLKDYPSALAEFEESEDNFWDVRPALDPEDTMGALAARAQVHNSKGYALMQLEPPRTAQARREFVRAVTYWPEYPEALLNIGRELMKRKRWDVAVRTLNTALKWQPGSSFLQQAASEARRGLEESLEDEYEDEDDQYVV